MIHQFVEATPSEIPDYIPENTNGHCFHKWPTHPETQESTTKRKTFWKCCYCGFVFTATYGWRELPKSENHGTYVPKEYDYEHEEWNFKQPESCKSYQIARGVIIPNA